MTQDQRRTWLQKLDAECPYQIVLPRRQLMDDSAIMDFLLSYVGKVRPIRRRSMSRLRALLLRGGDGRGDLPVALRAEKRAISARRLSKPPTPADDLFQEETDDPLVADWRNLFKVKLWSRDGRHVERLCSPATASTRPARCSLLMAGGGRGRA